MAASGRTRSITIPTVSAKRTGLWGVLPVRTQPRAHKTPCNPWVEKKDCRLGQKDPWQCRRGATSFKRARTYRGAETSRPP